MRIVYTQSMQTMISTVSYAKHITSRYLLTKRVSFTRLEFLVCNKASAVPPHCFYSSLTSRTHTDTHTRMHASTRARTHTHRRFVLWLSAGLRDIYRSISVHIVSHCYGFGAVALFSVILSLYTVAGNFKSNNQNMSEVELWEYTWGTFLIFYDSNS